jgi:beta-glucuronidase
MRKVINFDQVPAAMWTEEFEAKVLNNHFQAFDKLNQLDILIGEMIWNFADFLTPQGTDFFKLA